MHWDRRTFLRSAAAVAASTVLPSFARAVAVAVPDRASLPPIDSKTRYVDWMAANRGEDRKYLGLRFDRFQVLVANRDLFSDAEKRAFLLTPREEFCLPANLSHAYDNDFLDIGFGVTISGPHLVGRMTSSINVQPGEKVLEIGTGSGYQSAILSNLTDKVWSIEIIKPLAERTRGVYDGLIEKGYGEYRTISTRRGDGYYGWEDAAPFDKIIVTCGIDHIPPPLLRQLKAEGLMVIPVGPPGAQHVLKVAKSEDLAGTVTVARTDIYNRRIVAFVPFTALAGDQIKDTHNQ
jgi:protein-L-isoaspartate(D-aspartate) O-methyltransferase